MIFLWNTYQYSHVFPIEFDTIFIVYDKNLISVRFCFEKTSFVEEGENKKLKYVIWP